MKGVPTPKRLGTYDLNVGVQHYWTLKFIGIAHCGLQACLSKYNIAAQIALIFIIEGIEKLRLFKRCLFKKFRNIYPKVWSHWHRCNKAQWVCRTGDRRSILSVESREGLVVQSTRSMYALKRRSQHPHNTMATCLRNKLISMLLGYSTGFRPSIHATGNCLLYT